MEAAHMISKSHARVLDIGCNDGTLLKCYPKEFTKVGIDPSDVAREVDGDIKVIQDLFPSEVFDREMKEEPFDIITSIAVCYDLEDPVALVKRIKKYLSKEGIWILEVAYMPAMLKMNSYDTICHEHLEYYSLAVLENMLQRADMTIVKAELNDSNGGSIRCYATHVETSRFKADECLRAITTLRQREFDMELDTDKPYREFQERINAHRQGLMALLKRLKSEGKIIHIYGASTKGNTILQWCGIDHSMIDYAADRNPEKHGARTLGTNIPIISEAESRAMKPDYYLVLPWHFKKEFLEREQESLEQGIGMIFPLPTIEVIKR